MNDNMKRPQIDNQVSPFSRGGGTKDFFRQRLTSFGLTMIAMGVCFPLYYLGLFGGVEGPLTPALLGERLGGMGVSKTHMLIFFLSFLIFAVTWNWVYNLVSLLIGSRMTCNKTSSHGMPCVAPVTRSKVVHKKTGIVAIQYVCTHGHKRPGANFHPVKKGAVSHTLWVISLLFCVIIACLS